MWSALSVIPIISEGYIIKLVLKPILWKILVN